MLTADFNRPMRRRLSLGLLSGAVMLGALCIASGASAKSAPISDGGAMPHGVSIAPPARFIEFCARAPEQCGVSGVNSRVETEKELYSRHYWRAAFANSRVTAEPAARWSFRGDSDASARGAALLVDRPQVQIDLSSGASTARLTSASFALLQEVNSRINRSIRDRSDARLYGVGDYWALPSAENGLSGDCEDHVLAKRARLLKAGVPIEAMSIALAMTRWGEAHAVLLVATDRGELVLDSLTSRIRPWDQVKYRWLERQAPGKTFDWVALS